SGDNASGRTCPLSKIVVDGLAVAGAEALRYSAAHPEISNLNFELKFRLRIDATLDHSALTTDMLTSPSPKVSVGPSGQQRRAEPSPLIPQQRVGVCGNSYWLVHAIFE